MSDIGGSFVDHSPDVVAVVTLQAVASRARRNIRFSAACSDCVLSRPERTCAEHAHSSRGGHTGTWQASRDAQPAALLYAAPMPQNPSARRMRSPPPCVFTFTSSYDVCRGSEVIVRWWRWWCWQVILPAAATAASEAKTATASMHPTCRFAICGAHLRYATIRWLLVYTWSLSFS